MSSLVETGLETTKNTSSDCCRGTRTYDVECPWRFTSFTPTSISFLQTLEQLVTSAEKDSIRKLLGWNVTISRQMEPKHDGRLLLDVEVRHQGCQWITPERPKNIFNFMFYCDFMIQVRTSSCILCLCIVFIDSILLLKSVKRILVTNHAYTAHFVHKTVYRGGFEKARKLEVIEKNWSDIWIQHIKISQNRLFTFLSQTKNLCKPV